MDHTAVREFARSQDGVATRSQLRTVGVDRWMLRRRVTTDRWQTRGSIVVLHNGPLSVRQRWWVGVLHAGPRAVLAGRTAATAFGLRRVDDGLIHVLVPPGRNIPSLAGIRVHESRHAHETPAVGVPPRQPLPEALICAGTWVSRAEVAAGLLATGVQQRKVRPDDLYRALIAAGPIRHATLMRQVINDIAGGAQSFAEIDATRLARRAGVPRPRRQSVRIVNGRRRYLDVDFGGWAMEIDGAVHERPEEFANDLLRHDDLVLAGDRVLRFAALTVRLHPEAVVRRMRQAHRTWPST